ncbi:MAG: hypothetical protein JWM34_2910 [Ilumatobacteraceae bacterium]|nr:hypothetical protein [Ilumatobacteraceae bacterium]
MANNPNPVLGPLLGKWWDPARPDHVAGGIVDTDRGSFTLELSAWPGEPPPRRARTLFPRVLHGDIRGTPVTLIDCLSTRVSHSFDGPPNEVLVVASTFISGDHVHAETKYRSAAVRLEHLDEWARRTPFKAERESSTGPIVKTTTYTQPPTLETHVTGADVQLGRRWIDTPNPISGPSFESHEELTFNFVTPVELASIEHDYVRPLRHLLGLAFDRTPRILSLTVRAHRPEDDDPWPPDVDVIHVVDDGGKARPLRATHFDINTFGFADTLTRWWVISEKLGTVLDLHTSIRENESYVSLRFLVAASALEGYHRVAEGKVTASPEHKARLTTILSPITDDDTRTWLRNQLMHSHRPPLRHRLTELAERGGDQFIAGIGNIGKWVDLIATGRDSVAHRDPAMRDVEADAAAAVRLIGSIEWLLNLLLFEDLGIDRAERDRILNDSSHWSSVTDYLRADVPDLFA